MIPRLISIAVGVWLMCAPSVLGHADGAPAAEAVDRIIGPLVISVAIIALWPVTRGLRRVNLVLGGLLVVTPPALAAVVAYPGEAIASAVLSGIAVCVAALVQGDADHGAFGGGWRSVWRDDVDTITG